MIVGATLLCDRKPGTVALPYLLKNPLVDRVYLNIEGKAFNIMTQTRDPKLDYDIWDVTSNWRKKPSYDQDQLRLLPIVTARNMAIDYALSRGADFLLFVDADVRPHPGSLEKLIELNMPLCGGLVPGRGAHSHVNYIFGEEERVGDLAYCTHGTCGFMLIRRDVFSLLRFRWGGDPRNPEQMLSEDPAYCVDYRQMTGNRFVIHTMAMADHIDFDQLTDESVARDDWSSLLL